jgi:RNA polymerase sigma factor (sigma-70 family)
MMATEMTDSTNQSAQQDESAVAAVRGGDAERYRELVERHERRVYAVAWSRLGDAALAEEATQEAFIRAYRRLWLLGDGAKFSGWVNTIARRVAINFGLRHRRELNKRKRWALENPDVSTGENSADETNPLHTPETLRQTLAELPDAHRECLVMFYLEGKSGAQAAAALGISESALRVRLHRARAAMRGRLEEKLEGSLAKLGPAKTLAPAIVAGVLASSSAKAATGGVGAAVASVLAKIGFTKWLLPFASFFSFIIFLPMLAISWLVVRMELKNFRDQKGFRARLFRERSRWWILWFALMMVGFWILLPRLNLGNWKTFCLIIAGIGLVTLPFQIRRLLINRSRYAIADTASSSVLFLSVLLVGLGWIPLGWCVTLIILQLFVMDWYQTQQPMRMDYNLFLRGAEGLLNADDADLQEKNNRSENELFAFARFLGTRWLASNHRLTEAGLELRLTPANATVWGMLRNLPSWSQDSRLLLQPDGRVTAQLGQRDRKILQRLRGENLPSDIELENVVARAIESAWGKFRTGDLAAAERAIGQMSEAEVFIKPRGRTVSTRVQRGIMIGCLLVIPVSFVLLKLYTGSFPSLSFQGMSRQNYKRAMNDLKTAKTEEKRFYALDRASKESFVAGHIEEARDYAQELMALLPKYKGDWNYGNAIQDANLVLGRIALREGNTEAAKKYLIVAGKSPGSPQMDSFGPNMTLAKDLLEKGERDAVLEYFMLCRKFWKMDHGKLDQWIQEVMDAKTPDFGANLLY